MCLTNDGEYRLNSLHNDMSHNYQDSIRQQDCHWLYRRAHRVCVDEPNVNIGRENCTAQDREQDECSFCHDVN